VPSIPSSHYPVRNISFRVERHLAHRTCHYTPVMAGRDGRLLHIYSVEQAKVFRDASSQSDDLEFPSMFAGNPCLCYEGLSPVNLRRKSSVYLSCPCLVSDTVKDMSGIRGKSKYLRSS
jgi:hypothetical protein